ncbi:MAG TPA: peptidyl-prolyl cis-trans isomerase [Acidimicrobiales bacterium]|nr:peptidyl-prolyl cis-trans isomerase [Acidimicrobiales bacterium]
MRKILLPALLLAVLPLASACSSTTYAVSVNGIQVSQSEMITQVREFQASPALSGITSKPKAAKAASILPTKVTAGLASSQIANILINVILKRRHLHITAFERSLAKSQISLTLASSGRSSALSGIDPGFEKILVEQSAASIALEASLGNITITESSVQRYYQANSDQFTNACIEDALFSTQADALGAAAAIQGGATFQSATTNALQSSGGTSTPDCGLLAPLPSQLRQELLSTPVGEVSQPVQVAGTASAQSPAASGWAIFEVLSKSPPVQFTNAAAPSVVSAMLQAATSSSPSNMLNSAIKSAGLAADISVNPADGVLSMGSKYTYGFNVSAPGSPPAKSTPSITTLPTQPGSAPAG